MLHKIIIFALIMLLPTVACADEIVINAVGDIMLAGSATAHFRRLGYDHAFAATAGELKRGDVTVGNLEAPLTQTGVEFAGKRFRFRASPKAAKALQKAGFTVLTLANNHMMDYGPSALQETIEHLENNGILHAGAGANLAAARLPAIVRIKGKTLAFLAYSLTFPSEFYAGGNRAGTAPGYLRYMHEDIYGAKATADYVVVSFHWGTEGASVPSGYQTAAGRAAIDAGADVVLGHHPHVLQGIEQYKKGLIVYSLGNFAFGSMSRTSTRSIIARITLEDGVKGVELIPLNVDNRQVRFQPKLLRKKDGNKLIAYMNLISREMGTTIGDSGERFHLEMARETPTARQGRKEHVPVIRSRGFAAGGEEEPGGNGRKPSWGTVGSGGTTAPDVALHRPGG